MNLGGYFVALTMAALISTAPVKTEDVNWRNLDNVAIEEFEARTGYITGSINVRSIPDKSGEKLGVLPKGTSVTVIAVSTSNPYNLNTYYITEYGGFIHAGYITFTAPSTGLDNNVAVMTPAANPRVQLAVNNILQNPELPNGCEITSLSIVLNYKGYAVDKCDMSDNYLPKWPDLTGDPENYYLREPRSNGFYCFATCLCTTIDNYNAANGTSIQYKNLTGLSATDLYAEIDLVVDKL